MPSNRADQLIELLRLQPHPEGGHYSEVFRSALAVEPPDGRGKRPSITTIYFLLRAGEHSALHRVLSDEIWHFYEGDPLQLVWCDPAFESVQRATLGAAAADCRPVAVVPAGHWQAARSTGAYTLVGCSVGPGFDFADFSMLSEPHRRAALQAKQPELVAFL
jgi:predicted cupin superfamily sugar epimerase